ncbi:MAG: hypothetical protein P8186_03615, partial [Anaerolineae bacterium]
MLNLYRWPLWRRAGALVLMLTLILEGCTQNPVAPAKEAPGDVPPPNPRISSEPVTLNVWMDLDF